MLQQTHLERDVWAASIYRCLAASSLLSPSLDARLPTVPVILHPSVPRGALPPPITARHLGFLRVDLTGESAGPGRFFPLFPAGKCSKLLNKLLGFLLYACCAVLQHLEAAFTVKTQAPHTCCHNHSCH